MLLNLDYHEMKKFLEYPCINVKKDGITYMIYVDNFNNIYSVKQLQNGFGKPLRTSLCIGSYPYNGGFIQK